MTSEPTAKRRVVETSEHWATYLVELADDGAVGGLSPGISR